MAEEMRIVSGAFKGRHLVAPRGRGTRPTIEKVREAIFDSLGGRVEGARVLDLFAGCGALGLEALSRGASHVVWCDDDARAVEAIRGNVALLALPPSAWTILQSTAREAIQRISRNLAEFDLAFLDPPYEAGLYDETMLGLALARVISPAGTVVVERSRRIVISPVYGDLILDRDRRYGDTCVAYYRRECRTEGSR